MANSKGTNRKDSFILNPMVGGNLSVFHHLPDYNIATKLYNKQESRV